MSKTRLGAALLGTALVAGLAYKLFIDGGLAAAVEHRAPGPCRRLGEVPGPEDFALDRERGVLYVSSHDRRRPTELGAIYAVDLRRPLGELGARRLPGRYPADFRPHGLSLLLRPDGERLLYVVSHPEAGRRALDFGARHHIEILGVSGRAVDGAVDHRGTLADPALVNPNDVHVLAENDLYVTRDHGATSALGKFVEDLFALPRASVLHYDGRAFRTAAAGVQYANGITATGGRLYVAACLGRAVHEYAIAGPGQLRPLRRLPLPTAPDNLAVDERGDLWTGAHAAPLRFLGHAHDAARPAPSQAVRIAVADGRSEVVYADAGGEIAGSSVAVRTGGLLLIGAVFDRHLLACAAP